MKKVHRKMAAVLITGILFSSPAMVLAKPQDQPANHEELKKLEENLDQTVENKIKRKEIKLEMKEVMKLNYTPEEYQALRALGENMQKENSKIKVIPVENIITKKGLLKFDTPPVIKEGRTLIPARALSESFGANVSWEADTKTVTIEKNDYRIIIQLNHQIAMVNEKEMFLDVPAEMMNHRTLVPLRFILESLGLKVDYDQELGTIEIEEAAAEETIKEMDEQEETAEASEDTVVVTAEPSILQDIVIAVTAGNNYPEDIIVVIHSREN
ncbi:copper amine oxidase N-terminal domain-containing protein [Geosporobacter ferrireducens]|uniref:Copper amine oxidase-like N-terminal domain-containing protein n=1 Tax=Geosporobacter ferrireducens TaxID=1424294 RepID=A0A1D8GGD4_9FIRM|nr:copper amine oxidase N-terminal domain-containing protein [Geosporobacter ferrireducens]AOT69969.1 hypothetical protein Gferi_10455 [Geosporobacter ferrireducens]MTI58354.1 copper amine oxidase N-terminal domain-containing protein [Geosporobacter ferrireducens]